MYPLPATVRPPNPGVPITVLGPITRVGMPGNWELLVMVKAPGPLPVNSRLPVATLARLIVWVALTIPSMVMAVRLLRTWPALDVRV